MHPWLNVCPCCDKKDPHGGEIELILVSAMSQRLWYVVSCPWDDRYKISVVANRKE